MRSLLWTLLCCLILSACSAAVPVPTPSPQPAAIRPTPDVRILPAPLYVLDRGQIARIDPDGSTRRQLTRVRIEFEGIPPISDADLHPTAGLVYVVGATRGDQLVRAAVDGSDPQLVYFAEDYQFSAVRWSPDAQYIYLRLQNNRATRDLPDGMYRIPATGGELELLHADDPVDDPLNPSPSIRSYAPFLWEPSGASLLVASFATFYDDCELLFWQPQRGELRRPDLPAGMQSLCGEAIWLSDHRTALLLIGPPAGPGVWQVDTETTAVTQVSAPGVLTRAPFRHGDDLLFVAVERVSDGFTFTLTRQSPDGTLTPLRSPFRETPLLIQWAPDGSGIVAVVRTATGSALRWYPVGSQLPVDLPQTESGVTWIKWGEVPPQG
ncbi:MAG: hypothetical protein K6356_09960 [Chloroflexus sp.]